MLQNHLIYKAWLLSLFCLLASCMGGSYKYTPPTGAAAADIFAATGNKGFIPLTISASATAGDYEAVKDIFEKYPEMKNQDSAIPGVRLITSALNSACSAEVVNMTLVKYLIKNGADVNGDSSRLAGGVATFSSLTAVMNSIQLKTNPLMIKMAASMNKTMKAIKKQSAKHGVTAGVATSAPSALEERYKLLKYLIKSGADVNLETGIGRPFTMAVNSVPAMKILIEAGADTSATEKTLKENVDSLESSVKLLNKYI